MSEGWTYKEISNIYIPIQDLKFLQKGAGRFVETCSTDYLLPLLTNLSYGDKTTIYTFPELEISIEDLTVGQYINKRNGILCRKVAESYLRLLQSMPAASSIILHPFGVITSSGIYEQLEKLARVEKRPYYSKIKVKLPTV